MPSCQLCGRPIAVHDRHIRFRLPEPVLQLPEQDRGPEVWKSEDDPDSAVMMDMPELGGFIRALLPVSLTGGYTVTFGVWVSIQTDDLKRAYDTWWADSYRDLKLEGYLANRLPLWDVLRAPVSLAVVDPDATPFCVSSSDPSLESLLTTEWDHDVVLSRLPS